MNENKEAQPTDTTDFTRVQKGKKKYSKTERVTESILDKNNVQWIKCEYVDRRGKVHRKWRLASTA